MVGSRLLVAGLLLFSFLPGCRRDPAGPTPEDPLFARYIALGNSITAGFESEGINDSTQNNAYSVLFAQRFNAPFEFARLRMPGCPAPLIGSILQTSERVAGARVTDCALIHLPLPSVNHSLAVPGAMIADALRVPAPTGNIYDVFLTELYRQIFGSRTLVGAMIGASPSLVSVWLGQNDVLSAITAGNPGLMTPLTDFEASVAQLASAIDASTAREVVWLGVLDPVIVPLAQPGAYFWILAQSEEMQPWLRGKAVDENCAPLLATGFPNPLASHTISARIVRDPGVTEISCEPGSPYLLTQAERGQITARVVGFNRAIRDRVEAEGWIYIDINEIVARFLDDPQRIRNCQLLAAARTAAQLMAAFNASCPHADAPNFFGSLVSFDGIHPSVEAQRIIADEMEAAVRTKHGL
jgi:hypothetical protein